MHFPVSGVDAPLWLPPLVAFGISFFTSMVGVSGAFLLLPFQMSVLGYFTPSVSATNLVFNLVAIPSGVYRYCKEGRMLWPLAWVVAAGSLPGLLIGWWLRVHWLSDPRYFKLFVAAVLGWIGWRLLASYMPGRSGAMEDGLPSGTLRSNRFTLRQAGFAFSGKQYHFDPRAVLLLAMLVGVVGGAYGIGGGAIIAPFLVAIFGLPVHAVAGAALFGTLATSLCGVALYTGLPAPAGMQTQPDWLLGLLFGLGGLAGMYLGARCQKFVPQRVLKLGMGLLLASLAAAYLIQFINSAQ